MRHFAMTGTDTPATMASTIVGSAMRATPPAARMSAGTRSRAMTATAPASSAIFACSAVTTSMITPPLSIWARPFFVAQVEVWRVIRYTFLRLGAAGGPRTQSDYRTGRIELRVAARPRCRRGSATEGSDDPRDQPDGPPCGRRRQPAQRIDEREDVLVVEVVQEAEQAQDSVVGHAP